MGKLTCPFCNSQNTSNIAYGYLGKKKTKKNYIRGEDIGLNESYRKESLKYDFDVERLMRHLSNRYYKTCKNNSQSRKVMYTVDISIINFIICINNNYYRYILDFSDKEDKKFQIVHGDTDSTRDIKFFLYGTKHLDFNSWIEVEEGQKTWIYDLFSLLKIEKSIYYQLEHPSINKVIPGEAVLNHPGSDRENYTEFHDGFIKILFSQMPIMKKI